MYTHAYTKPKTVYFSNHSYTANDCRGSKGLDFIFYDTLQNGELLNVVLQHF